VTIDGVATFQENERVLVFLQESDNGNFTVYGWMNGKYELDGEKIKTSEMARFNSIFENISTLEQITNEVRKHKINDAVNISTDKLNLDITPNKDANSEADMIIKKSQ
jgi:hypothetical protein